MCGTPPCVAPEPLRERLLDQRADLYSLGALGYWLLTSVHASLATSLGELPRLFQTSPVSSEGLFADDGHLVTRVQLTMNSSPALVTERASKGIQIALGLSGANAGFIVLAGQDGVAASFGVEPRGGAGVMGARASASGLRRR